MPTTVDTREFNKAMDEYLAVSSKDRATVANSKLRDWMFKSLKANPNAEREEIKKVIESPKLIAWFTSNRLGGRGWDRDDWNESRKMLRKRLSAVSWGRSGWSKAANKIPDSREPRPGKERKPIGGNRMARFKGTLARIRLAKRGDKNKAVADIDWAVARDSGPLARISDRALRDGQRLMVRDTQKYIERKLQKIGRKVSA